MSKVKLKHASGNSMSIAAPATNPASDLELKLPATITPSASSSKILILVNVSFCLNGDNNAFLQLLRGSTVINSGSSGNETAWTAINSNATAFRYSAAQQACNYLDSPSTTSATTYKVQTKVANGSTTLSINRRPDDTEFGISSNITLLEVAG